MAPISPGTLGDPVRRTRKAKPTPTTKLHRYESFTKRIAKLKIDPIHVVDHNKVENSATSLSHSFFHESLEQWAELNLTLTFTSFSNKVTSLSENLPQIIHHADKIFALLVQHIEKQDVLALEPLLSLLAHLAHDLGQKYEKYFARTVEVVTNVAVNHESADVIEWCFTCLAWMFKFLSRLLIHDLRPLLGIMIPYLSAKRDYIVRFSAEALAFLVRKAAAVYRKKRAPLHLAVSYLLGRIVETQQPATLHSLQGGVMSLFVESCKGIDNQLYTSADSLVQSLLASGDTFSGDENVETTITGVVIALVHETNGTTFQPILDTILTYCQRQVTSTDEMNGAWPLQLLHVMVGTRKGTRVRTWPETIKTFLQLWEVSMNKVEMKRTSNRLVIQVAAEILQYAPMDQLLPFSKEILSLLISHLSPRDFFAFSVICADMGKDRFVDLVLPQLQQYIHTRWSEDEQGLLYTLEHLGSENLISSKAGANNLVECPSNFSDLVMKQIEDIPSQNATYSLEALAGRLRLVKNTQFAKDGESRSRLLHGLLRMITATIDDSTFEIDMRKLLILGWGLEAYLIALPEAEYKHSDLVPSLLTVTSTSFSSPLFLRLCNTLLESNLTLEDGEVLEKARSCLVQNLLKGSKSLKEESLKMLHILLPKMVDPAVRESISLMSEILNTPYTPADARQLSMLLRRLPRYQNSLTSISILQDMVPFFCLGLLSHFHDKVRKDVCDALAKLVENSETEETILNVVFEWIRTPNVPRLPVSEQEKPEAKPTQFECTNLSHVDNISDQVFDDLCDPEKSLRIRIDKSHHLETSTMPPNARLLGLQVLNSLSSSAERRSRLMVPIFLAAPLNRAELQPHQNSDASISSHTLSPEIDDHEWSLPDRKELVLLFTKFNNPRVLFRSSEVLEKLTALLSNGNSDIRKSALRAVLKWKDPILISYEETLLDVAEDKKSPADLGELLSLEEGETSIKSDDRKVLLPVLLRLIFGSIVGRAGSTGSQEARRRSILRSLFRLTAPEITLFLDITLGALKDVRLKDSQTTDSFVSQLVVPEDQQYGLLRLLLAFLETMKSKFAVFGEQIVDAIVLCTVHASKDTASASALSRSIRRTGIQCLVLLSEHCPTIEWSPFLALVFERVISPRLELFATETSQGISGLLRLFAVWTHSHSLVGYLESYDSRLAGVFWQCLTNPSAQKDVKVYILEEIVIPWLTLAEDAVVGRNAARDYMQAEADALLSALTVLLEQTPPRDILNAVTSSLPRLAVFAMSTETKEKTIVLLQTLLEGSAYKLSPEIKSKLLLSINSLLGTDENLSKGATSQSLWILVSTMFNYFKDDANRQILCQMLALLARHEPELTRVVQLCLDMNSISSQRLGEYDYEKRLEAFASITSLQIEGPQTTLWLPIVYNLLFFVRTVEDFSIRSNALACLRQFVVKACESEYSSHREMIRSSLLPAVRKGARDDSEHVRADFVSLFGLLVQHLRGDPDLVDMTVLLVGNDEEASFFSNILHIQQHRRVRAIRRLVSEVEKGLISHNNIADFFIPLLEKFVHDSTGDESLQGVKGQSIAAMAILLQWIDWKQFKILFRRYKDDIGIAGDSQKNSVKLLGHAADALLCASRSPETEDCLKQDKKPILGMSISGKTALQQELRTQFIPKLAELVHYKDETEISFRIPIAVTNIKLIKMLPEEEISLAAAPVVLDIANILRSRTQESRDVARNALSQIVVLLGFSSVQFVVNQLRTALTRGYQLHVLSYTLHSILLALAPEADVGAMDYCIDDLVSVVIDDTFGATGQEKENQDYISSMKEVKKNKSYDSMELLARSTSVPALSKLVSPIQTILSGTLTTKQVRQVDELIRRLGIGVSQNPAASHRQLLVFAYQLIQAFYKQRDATPARALTQDEKNRQRYLVQLTASHKSTTSRASPLLYKLARFALDLVRSTLQKHDELSTPENVHGFLPVIGDALIEASEDVKISALRLLSAILRLKMPELDLNAPLYVMEAIKMVRNSTNTNEEGAQAALKLISAMLRERKTVKLRDSDIAELLHRITPDIEEPDRQGVTFNFIRAVMSRKFQSPELYDLVDKIGIMMVTNHARSARDVARGVYVHFLLEYPQSTARWSKQQKFLLKNLEYDHPEGRQSVMEAINTLILKLKGETAEDLAASLFIHVLLRMANDENETCRELAGVLLGQLFRSADTKRLDEFLETLESWIVQDQKLELQKISMQAYGILLDSGVKVAEANLIHLRETISKSLRRQETDDVDEWELQFQSLILLSKLVKTQPSLVLQQRQAKLWSPVWKLLGHSNTWIQVTAASLVQDFFQDCPSDTRNTIPLVSGHGLRLGADDFLTALRSSVRTLRRLDGSESLSIKTTANLLIMAKCLDVNGLTMLVAEKSDSELVDEVDGLVADDDEPKKTKEIPAIQYLMDQVAGILRVEIKLLKSNSLQPKISALQLFIAALPDLSPQSLNSAAIRAILLPLQHLTDTNTIAPRSADPTFSATYQNLVELAQNAMEGLQRKIGDADYIKALTEVSKIMRQRRDERRTKRRIERVAEPERAAIAKRRKGDRKKERKREIGRSHQKRRREV